MHPYNWLIEQLNATEKCNDWDSSNLGKIFGANSRWWRVTKSEDTLANGLLKRLTIYAGHSNLPNYSMDLLGDGSIRMHFSPKALMFQELMMLNNFIPNNMILRDSRNNWRLATRESQYYTGIHIGNDGKVLSTIIPIPIPHTGRYEERKTFYKQLKIWRKAIEVKESIIGAQHVRDRIVTNNEYTNSTFLNLMAAGKLNPLGAHLIDELDWHIGNDYKTITTPSLRKLIDTYMSANIDDIVQAFNNGEYHDPKTENDQSQNEAAA